MCGRRAARGNRPRGYRCDNGWVIFKGMSFTFRQLEIFVEAAIDGNFRKTADRIGISQPAISKHVSALEKSLDKALFTRSRGSSARLSAEGKLLLPAAREILARRGCFTPAEGSKEPLHLTVLVGAHLLETVVRPVIADIHNLFPKLSMEFVAISGAREVDERFKSGTADLAIYTGHAPERPGPSVEVLSVIGCSLYAAPDLADRFDGDLGRLSAMPFVLPLAHHPAGHWTTEALSRAGITPSNVAARLQFGHVLAGMVAEGRGLGLLFDDHARRQLGTKVRRLPIEIGPAFRVMVRGNKAHHPDAVECVHFLRQLMMSG
jgi:DNA-binding transcriptional LysR family regulator